MRVVDHRRLAVALALGVLALTPAAAAPCERCDGAPAAKQAVRPKASYLRSTHDYAPPAVTLVDQDGRRVPLAEILAPGAPLAVNFVFTTCTTICPVMSATFSGLRRRLGEEGVKARLVSISIDPEQDRPAALRAYSARFGADPAWRLYTGSVADVRAVLNAFDAFAGDKANHRPLTLLRPAFGRDWIRIEGLASGEDLAKELRELRADR